MAFDFFRKKKRGPAIRDLLWMHHTARMNAVLELLRKEPGVIVIAWFERSKKEWQSFFDREEIQLTVQLARQLNAPAIIGKKVYLVEHYPLASREDEWFASMDMKELTVFNALDDALFMKFGGDGIIEMMRKMGASEAESFSHSMITKAIRNAQEKLEKKVTNELHANSQDEWFRLNLTE